ncbi:MAG TPA: hypothetical protein V6C89_18685 [Drouetiella sp.]
MLDQQLDAILNIKSLKMLALNKSGVSQLQLKRIEADHWRKAAFALSGNDDVHLVLLRSL